MLSDTLEVVGIPRGDYVVRVNNRKVLNGVMEVAGLSGDDKEAERAIVLRAIDKLDRLGTDGVRALLGEGRKDGSGDFTKGAGLNELQINAVMRFANAKSIIQQRLADVAIHEVSSTELPPVASNMALANIVDRRVPLASETLEKLNLFTLSYLKEIIGDSVEGQEGVSELFQIKDLLENQGYGPDRIMIDPSVVRGLGYYTGPVFEAELTFEVLDDKGRPRNFGSVAGGGRYDDLVTRFTGQKVPATGVSIGVDRLLAALHAKGRLDTAAVGPVVVTVMDRDQMAYYQGLVAELRNAGIRAEVYLGNPKNFGNQLKYADNRNSPVAVIAGSDEMANGVVQIKDLVLGAQIAQSATLEEWKDRPSQYEVPRTELVAKVREILAGQAG
jgi:histidyl-tRNA synthetase